MKVYTADKIFSGSDWLPDHALVTDRDIIVDILPIVSLPEGTNIDGHSKTIVPGFIDIQIYGASGKLFASYPSADTLQLMYEYCVTGGAWHFLPTVATNTYEVFYKCIDAVREYHNKGGKGVPGLHIEGPWINKSKRGAHIEGLIHSPTVQQVKTLLDYGNGIIKMITLAPEVCSHEILSLIRSYGVIISAGHSDATFDEATESFAHGVLAATHLFNAMSPLHHREPGLAGAIFQHPSVVSSIIADGHHVNYEMISIAKKLLGDRLFLITDAVTETTLGLYQHQRDGDKYVCGSTLSGSALTMMQAVNNCVDFAGISLSEAIRMASLYPARLLGMEGEVGMLRKGYRAEFNIME